MHDIIARRVAQTNFPYRLVEITDLVPGRDDIIMIDEYVSPIDPTADPAFLGTRIQLDDPPVRPTSLGDRVFYHCTRPAWEGQCFVPVDSFTGQVPESIHYWIPIGPEDGSAPPVRAVGKLGCACGKYADGRINHHGDPACADWPACVTD